MEALAARVIEGLAGGMPKLDLLARAGEPEPETAARAFAEAANDPDLGHAQAVWIPALLRSARPGFGARCLLELAQETRSRGGRPLDVAGSPSLPLLLGSSNVLARQLLRNPDWAANLEGELPTAPPASTPAPSWDAIRSFKYRGLLRIAARDLAGRPFAESPAELSDLADRCLVAGLACAANDTGVAAPALLALGKLGGAELNFSSDVDVLFLYEPPEGSDDLEHNHAVAGLVRHLKQQLEGPTANGFAYRVDLDLRPEGRTGALANSVDAALTYYETFGAEWERQMLLRLRPVAGADAAAGAFCAGIRPFVYRRSIDPRVLDEVRAMKARIEDERRRAGRDIDAELKDGPGGIRDVEFLVQSLQLFMGGREPELRTGNVLEALAALGRLGLLPEATAAALSSAYLWLRRAEHALQLAEEQQTARFPRETAAQIALSRRMGYTNPDAREAHARMMEDWTSVRSEVRHHFDALVLRDGE
jgi:glutamate-ammonia-ligase adenylyltransferase